MLCCASMIKAKREMETRTLSLCNQQGPDICICWYSTAINFIASGSLLRVLNSHEFKHGSLSFMDRATMGGCRERKIPVHSNLYGERPRPSKGPGN